MVGRRTRFERWRAKLPKHTRYLVDEVLTCIVPEFEARGFKWYDDFAGGDPKEIGYNEIPLQRREGEQWLTVQIHLINGVALHFISILRCFHRFADDGELMSFIPGRN